MIGRSARAIAVGLGLAFLLGTSGPAASAVPTPTPTPTPLATPGPYTSGSVNPQPQKSFSLSVSPTRIDLSATKADGKHVFTVSNRGKSAVAVTVTKNNFTTGTDGALRIAATGPYSATNWATVSPAQFTLPAMTSMPVTVAITMPDKPELGDHQVALTFVVPAGETSGNIKINRGIGAPVLITVPGKTTNTTLVSSLSAPWFALRGPVDVEATVKDTGNVHRDFRGPNRLVVTGDGKTATFGDFVVLRESTRNIATTYDPPFFCICQLTLSIPAVDGSISSSTATVIVFPVDLLLILIAVLVIAYFARRYRKRRFHERIAAAAAALHAADALAAADGRSAA